MTEVLAAFGIDWRLLAINMVNFGLLLLALWYFLYGPLMRILDERRRTVQKGVEDARAAVREREAIEHSRQGILAEAGKEADVLLSEAREAAVTKERELRARGEAQAQAALEEAGREAQELKRQALEESKREVAQLIVLGIEKTAK